MSTKEKQCASCKGTGCTVSGCDGNCETGGLRHPTCRDCAGFGTIETEDVVTMTRAEWEAIKKHMEDLERSAASAREIARAAMWSTGTRAIRAEMVIHSDGTIQIIVCDPAGDEIETARRVAKLMDAGILSRIGAKPKDDEPVPVGSMA